MFDSTKFAWVTFGMYTAIVLLPGAFLDSNLIPEEYLRIAMIGCALFIVGVLAGALLFPFRAPATLQIDAPALHRGLAWTVGLQLIGALYVFAAGPTSPLIAGLTMEDAFELAVLREGAVKLNTDPIFVTVYAWSRDVLSPIAFVLGVHTLRCSRSVGTRRLAWVGMLLALALGLWSGQKATVVNYLVAAIIFSALSGWSMVRTFLKLVPLLVLAVLAIFALTLPQLFSGNLDIGDASDVLFQAVIHRILLGPLELAAAYVYSVDELHIISRFDVLPIGSALWTPGIGTVENRIGLEFFYSGIDSISANGLAFAYALVLGGYLACLIGGVLVVATYKACTWLVRSSGSMYMSAAYGALLSYHSLDLLNGNFMGYLITAGEYAVLLWLIGSLRVRPVAAGGAADVARSVDVAR
jgi:branched-subunit amino acid transport protein AzlD